MLESLPECSKQRLLTNIAAAFSFLIFRLQYLSKKKKKKFKYLRKNSSNILLNKCKVPSLINNLSDEKEKILIINKR